MNWGARFLKRKYSFLPTGSGPVVFGRINCYLMSMGVERQRQIYFRHLFFSVTLLLSCNKKLDN